MAIVGSLPFGKTKSIPAIHPYPYPRLFFTYLTYESHIQEVVMGKGQNFELETSRTFSVKKRAGLALTRVEPSQAKFF